MAVRRRLELADGSLLRLGDDSGYLLLARGRRLTPLSNYTSTKSEPLNVSTISPLFTLTEND